MSVTTTPDPTPFAEDDLGQRIAAIVREVAPDLALADRSRENEAVFDSRAPWYDKGSAPDIYLSPDRLVPIIERCLTPGQGPVLDLACGTGFMGARLRALGHNDLVGCDVSQAMLARAATAGHYGQLVRADLHQPLPFPPDSFDAAVCAGAFFAESVAPMALAHILPVLRPGGWLICDVEQVAWTAEGFEATFARLADLGLLSELEVAQGHIFAPGVIENEAEAGCSASAVFVAARRN